MKGVVWAVFVFAVGGLAQLAATPAAPQAKDDIGATGGRVRTYYVAAEEVEWDYAPLGIDMTTTANRSRERRWRTPSRDRITSGAIYRKAIYREYTDATFTTRKPRAPQDEYLGLLGPILRAEVGDTIKVVFKNNASRPYSMHPHGVFYEKASEGSMYADNVSRRSKDRGHGAARGDVHLRVGGTGTGRSGARRSQLDRLAVPLTRQRIQRRGCRPGGRHRRGSARPDERRRHCPKTSTAKSSRSSPHSTKTRVGMWIRTWPPTSAPPTRRR